MVASKMNMEFQEHLTQRILCRLCEAAELVTSNVTANRLRLRELLDDLAFELDAGDLALSTIGLEETHPTSTCRRMKVVSRSVHN